MDIRSQRVDFFKSLNVLITEVGDLISMTDTLQDQTETKIDGLCDMRDKLEAVGSEFQKQLTAVENLKETMLDFQDLQNDLYYGSDKEITV